MTFVPGEEIRRMPVMSDNRTHYIIPSGGYLERLEIRPIQGYIPNMDSSNPYKLIVDLISPNGSKIPISVDLWWRTVVEER